MASTCRKLALAVPLMLERKPLFQLLSKPGRQQSCLSSPLMLHWAPHVKHGFLSAQCTQYPGINAFAAAATCLKLAGLIYPRQESLIPSTPSRLYCYEADNDELAKQPWTAAEPYSHAQVPDLAHLSIHEQLDGFLLALSCMPNLQSLVVQMNEKTELQSTVVLPSQVELHVQLITSSRNPLTLQWLRLQSSSKLHIHLTLSLLTQSQAQQAVSELQTLQFDSLHIQTRYDHFASEAQLIWSQLSCCRYFHLAFSGHQGAVHALPVCEHALISGPIPTAAQPVQQTFHASWPALGNRSGKVYISLDKSQQLLVEGHAELPLPSPGPWQLLVISGAGLRVLPPSQATQGTYLLQNAAADSAGWRATEKISFQCICRISCGDHRLESCQPKRC